MTRPCLGNLEDDEHLYRLIPAGLKAPSGTELPTKTPARLTVAAVVRVGAPIPADLLTGPCPYGRIDRYLQPHPFVEVRHFVPDGWEDDTSGFATEPRPRGPARPSRGRWLPTWPAMCVQIVCDELAIAWQP